MNHSPNTTPVRRVLVACMLALAAGLAFAGCSKALQNVPETFTEGYEAADFAKFNSPAGENGLRDTLVWFEGTVGELTDASMGLAGTSWHAMVKDADDNAWLVIMDVDGYYPDGGGRQQYEAVVGHTVCITGAYLGYSVSEGAPGVALIRLFDRESGTVVTSEYGTARYESGE